MVVPHLLQLVYQEALELLTFGLALSISSLDETKKVVRAGVSPSCLLAQNMTLFSLLPLFSYWFYVGTELAYVYLVHHVD